MMERGRWWGTLAGEGRGAALALLGAGVVLWAALGACVSDDPSADADAREDIGLDADIAAPVACSADPECGGGEVCQRGRCVRTCGAQRPCPEGQSCGPAGHCVACLRDTQCIPGYICEPVQGACVPGCAADSGCGSAERCAAGRCVPRDMPAPACTAGERRCAGEAVERCEGEPLAYRVVERCASGTFCSVQAGSPACPSSQGCEEGRERCARNEAGDDVVERCAGGVWTRREVCPELCRAGVCVDASCAGDPAYCEGELRWSCDPGAAFWVREDCTRDGATCEGGACVARSCTPHESRCGEDPTLRYVCDARGLGEETLACDAGARCIDGVCRGQVCDPNDFPYCSGREVRGCAADGSAILTLLTCPTGQRCIDGFAGALCVAACDGPDACLPGQAQGCRDGASRWTCVEDDQGCFVRRAEPCGGEATCVEAGGAGRCEVPVPRCGDGVISGGETCDDGNTQSGDGCSSTCQVEPGHRCFGQPSSCSLGGDTCDQAPEIGPGRYDIDTRPFTSQVVNVTAPCNTSIQLVNKDAAYKIQLPAGHVLQVTRVSSFWEGWLMLASRCPDPGGACLRLERDNPIRYTNQTNAPMTLWLIAAGRMSTSSSSGPMTFDVATRELRCGDGFRDGDERCDDGNTRDGDGCSSSCRVEDGWFCFHEPSTCLNGGNSCATAVRLELGTHRLSNAPYWNTHGNLGSSCGSQRVEGGDTVFRVRVPAGRTLRAVVSDATFQHVFALLTSCTFSTGCQSHVTGDTLSSRTLTWTNTGSSDTDILVYVGGRYFGSSGSYTLTLSHP